jgi:hypothetical protein
LPGGFTVRLFLSLYKYNDPSFQPYIVLNMHPVEERMSEENKNRTVRVDLAGLTGMLWFGGWLFTIAFAKLAFWPAVTGLFIWPYYLGVIARGG